MGKSHRKVLSLTTSLRRFLFGMLLLTAMLSAAPLFAQFSSETYTILHNYVLPQYGTDEGDLEFLIYGASAVNKGTSIYLTSPFMDIVGNEIKSLKQITTVQSGDKVPVPYDLGAKSKIIRDFWQNPLYSHSQSWIFGNKAVYDKNTRVLSSDDKAFFRSRLMDADGIGFDAFPQKKFIHVRSNVHVILRIDSDPGETPPADITSDNSTSQTTSISGASSTPRTTKGPDKP